MQVRYAIISNGKKEKKEDTMNQERWLSHVIRGEPHARRKIEESNVGPTPRGDPNLESRINHDFRFLGEICWPKA